VTDRIRREQGSFPRLSPLPDNVAQSAHSLAAWLGVVQSRGFAVSSQPTASLSITSACDHSALAGNHAEAVVLDYGAELGRARRVKPAGTARRRGDLPHPLRNPKPRVALTITGPVCTLMCCRACPFGAFQCHRKKPRTSCAQRPRRLDSSPAPLYVAGPNGVCAS
jgi:hypothetical protein